MFRFKIRKTNLEIITVVYHGCPTNELKLLYKIYLIVEGKMSRKTEVDIYIPSTNATLSAELHIVNFSAHSPSLYYSEMLLRN